MCVCVGGGGGGDHFYSASTSVPSLLLAQRFTVQPESVVQAEGLEAVFECQYLEALAHTWRLNGVFLAEGQSLPNVTRAPASGDSPARLTILATPQYNNTVVQCEALAREGGAGVSFMSVLSNNATLRVQGNTYLIKAVMLLCYYT